MPKPNPSEPSSPQISRRTLLGAAASLAVLQAAAPAEAKEPPKQAAEPNLSPHSAPDDAPGLLAKSRLNAETVDLMTGATRFCAMRAKEVAGQPKEGVKSSIIFDDRSPYERRVHSFEAGIFRQTFYFNYSPLFTQGLPRGEPTPQETAMARRLADLLLRDELWTEPELSSQPGSQPFAPDFVFRFADRFPGVWVSVCPNAHQMRVEWENGSASRSSTLLFDPVGKEMTAFIKEAFPDDPDAQSLVFVPKPVAPPTPFPTRPPDVSPEIWAKAVALRPGMTRADLLQCFEEEGGISSRYGRVYNMQRNGPRWGGLRVKIRAEFVPAGFSLLWRSGKGFLRNPEDRYKAGHHEMPGDIITSLSPMYLGLFYGGA